MYVSAIVLAAGESQRFGGKKQKLFINIRREPAIIYSLKALQDHPYIREIILVAHEQNIERLEAIGKKYRIKKIRSVLLGGRLRQDSVSNGLKAIAAKTDLVMIHDGARPFVDRELLFRVICSAARYGAAIAAVPVKATIKEAVLSGVTGQHQVLVKKTIKREGLWETQTPQVFRKNLIVKAYHRFGKQEVTDDAALVEKTGAKVRIVMGSYFNIKITTPEDMIAAKAIAKNRL